MITAAFRLPAPNALPRMANALVRRLAGAIAAMALIASGTPSTAATQASSPPSSQASNRPVLLILGDSISAEYGLARDTGWVKLLEARLRDEH